VKRVRIIRDRNLNLPRGRRRKWKPRRSMNGIQLLFAYKCGDANIAIVDV
jgi:hypothetical protein